MDGLPDYAERMRVARSIVVAVVVAGAAASAAAESTPSLTETRVVAVGEGGRVEDRKAVGWGVQAAALVEGIVGDGLRGLLRDLGARESDPALTGTALAVWFEPAPEWRLGAFWHQTVGEDERPVDRDRVAQVGTVLRRSGLLGRWHRTHGVWGWGGGLGLGLGRLELTARRISLGSVGDFDAYVGGLREDLATTTWSRSFEGAGPTALADIGGELRLADWIALQARGGWHGLYIPAQGWVDLATAARPGNAPSRGLHGWAVSLGVVVGRLHAD